MRPWLLTEYISFHRLLWSGLWNLRTRHRSDSEYEGNDRLVPFSYAEFVLFECKKLWIDSFVIRNLNLKISKMTNLKFSFELRKNDKKSYCSFQKNYILQKMNTHLVSLEIEVSTKEFTWNRVSQFQLSSNDHSEGFYGCSLSRVQWKNLWFSL